MTEAEWLACTEPEAMLKFLCPVSGLRKLRLAACAFSRRVLPQMTERACRLAIEAAEQYADGTLDKPDYVSIAHNFDRIRRARFPKAPTRDDDAWNAIYCTVHRRWESEHDSYFDKERWQWAAAEARDAACFAGDDETGVQAAIVRDVFGNPFCPARISSDWLSWNVVQLARSAYAQRQMPNGDLDPDRLAVLADALEEAGATDPPLLDHLRGPARARMLCARFSARPAVVTTNQTR